MQIIKDAVTEEELQKSAVYIIPEMKSGDNVVIDRKLTRIESPSFLLFIDLEPGVNWSHKCRYMLVDGDGKLLLKTEGQFPPDTEKLQLVLKPENIEEWMLLTNKLLAD